MGFHVGIKVAFGGELLMALFALEGLFTSVDFLMSLEVGDLLTVSNDKSVVYLCEGFVAARVVALVRLLAGVDP